jgi:hypothetical protein
MPRADNRSASTKREAARRRPLALLSELFLRGEGARLARRKAAKPRPTKPSIIIAQVDGSGTLEPMSNSNALFVELAVKKTIGQILHIRNSKGSY